MATEVILPKVDMDMATGQIARWFAGEGDTVKKGDPLFEIETDKAAMEVDAPASGILREVTGREGIDIPVGQAVAWIYAEGEASRTGAPAAPAGADATAAAPAVADATAAPAAGDADARLPSDAEAKALIGAAAPAARKAPAPAASPAPASAIAGRLRATPLARRLARENNVALDALSGSGPRGRIQREDVEGHLARSLAEVASSKKPVPAEAAVPAAAPAPAARAPAAPAPARPAAAAPARMPADAPLHAVWLREGEGTPIVLLHGFGSEIASWRPFLPAFDRPVPMLALDLPGHGGSVETPAPSFADLVAAVEGTLAAYRVTRAHLVGHSLGGAVAAAVAAGGSLEAASLFLLAPAGLGAEIDTGFTEGFAGASDERSLAVWMARLVAEPGVLSDSFVKATARARADGRHADAQTRLGRMLFAEGTQLVSTRALFDHLAMPVKVVVGTADRVIPSRQAAGLPGHVALHRFAGVGHMPHLERKAEVARLLAEIAR